MRRWPTKKTAVVKKFIYLHDKIVQKAINPSFSCEIPMDRDRAHHVASACAHDLLHVNQNWTIAVYWKYLHNVNNTIRWQHSRHDVANQLQL